MEFVTVILKITVIIICCYALAIGFRCVSKKWKKYGFFDKLFLVILILFFIGAAFMVF